MIKAASFPEAHQQRYLLPPYPAVYLNTYITNLIADFRDAKLSDHLDGGQALFAEYEEGVAATHAHPVDQWQIYVAGSAYLNQTTQPSYPTLGSVADGGAAILAARTGRRPVPPKLAVRHCAKLLWFDLAKKPVQLVTLQYTDAWVPEVVGCAPRAERGPL
ncbi:MAG TPA: hypothetical protein VNN62_02705 [Methylomirabilota bacterium]|jgi:hypothetical protein|nr:hypothetical protein [Methylomirabilota bacterium]